MSEFIVEPKRKISVFGEYDVVVAGGGPAGFGAAVAAARNGAKTLMIERYGFLGGMLTAGYVLGLHTDKTMPLKQYGEEVPSIGGVAQELVEKLLDMRGVIPPDLWLKYKNTPDFLHPSDPEMMKIALMDMTEDSGAKQLLHAYVVDTIVDENEVKGVIIESKSGRQAVKADVVVDCTGDGDVAAFAGCEYEKATQRLLPMSPVALWGGIDIEKARKITPKERSEIMEKAKKAGIRDYPEFAPRPFGSLPETPDTYKVPALGMIGWMKLPPDLEKKVWQRTDRHGWYGHYYADCTNVHDLTAAEIWTRKQLLPVLKFLRENVPGYENTYIVSTPVTMGLRESRRVLGEYVLTWQYDVLKQRKHDDVVSVGRPIMGPTFDVPYRCMVPRKIDGILTAGRCISVEHAVARQIAIRDEIQAIGFGQASGTAAAIAIKEKVKPREVDVPTLQETLKAQGVWLG